MSLNFYSAFLLASGLAYFCSLILPYSSLKNLDRVKERISFFLLGTTIILLVMARERNLFNQWWAWTILGTLYVMASWLSYVRYSQWNMLQKEEISDAAQMYMAAWNLLIAISCFLMI